MTTTQDIIWTALPYGRSDDGRLRLSAFVSPRLRTDDVPSLLGAFPNFLEWAATVNDMTFTVRRPTDPNELPTERLGPTADQSLWPLLFGPETPVRPFAFKDHSARNIRSFSVDSVMTYLTGLYQDAAQLSPDDLPLIEPEDGAPQDGTLAGLVQELGGVLWHFRIPHGRGAQDRLREQWLGHRAGTTGFDWSGDDMLVAAKKWARERRFHALDGAFASTRVVEPGTNPATYGFASQTAMDFYQANRFFDRPEDQHEYVPAPDAAKIAPPPDVPDFDFHQAVGILADYPAIVRRLGLVIDLAIDGDLPATGEIRVTAHWGEAHPAAAFSTDHAPATSYALDEDRFLARPLDPTRLADGMIALDGATDDFETGGATTRYGIVQVDPDGAALKTVATAVNLKSLLFDAAQGRAAFDTPDRTGLAPMRTVGVAVFAKDRALSLHGDLVDAALRDGSVSFDDIVHSAEHLLRGFRVDVFDEDAGAWRSLCRRIGSYTIQSPGAAAVSVTESDGSPIVDEGYIKAASTSSADDAASDLYLHETMFRWDGWSLVAKRPGRTIVPVPSNGGLQQEESVAVPAAVLATDFKLETAFEPVKGSLPRLRFGHTYKFRVRGVDLAGNSIAPETDDEVHASGAIFFGRFDPVAPPAIVPRAELTEGESVERMVIRSNYDQTTTSYASGSGGAAENDRHVVPPKSSQEMAERHGAFDDAFGPAGSPATAYAIAVREAATLAHTHVPIPGSSPIAYQPVAGSQMVPGTVPPDAPSDAEPQGAYLVNTQSLFPLAYLPDVAARGAAMRGVPGTDAAMLVEFSGEWPDYAPFVLRIAESPGTVVDGDCREALEEDPKAPHWDVDQRVLTVYLPKATTAKVRYSCYPSALDDFATWQRWMAGAVDEQLVGEGGHWMLSPFRELVLVHAVQQPLCPPTVRMDAHRFTGETFARLQGLVVMSVRSTGQLDLAASWTEPIDSLSEPGPKDVPGRGHVASLRVDDDLPEPYPFPKATPHPDGTLPMPQSGGLPLPLPIIGSLPEPFQITDPDAEGFMEPHDLQEFREGDIRHEFGDTRHRWVRYKLTGTTRFREYFRRDVASAPGAITRTGDEVLVNVLSSARPDAPRVKYIVPSWKWEQTPADASAWKTFRRTRIGGGLRVWLDRPWYSSGEDEKLAVVLWRGSGTPSEREGKRVSGFGMDPAWDAAVPSAMLAQADFGNVADQATDRSLAEAPGGQRVDVVAYEPEYDAVARRLWFCDIDLARKAGTSYNPFVRLALARYQRHAIWGAELSAVVQTDFHQLVPSRTLSLTFTGPLSLDVTLFGPAPFGPIRNRVEVTIEHHDGSIPGDLGWKLVPGISQPIHLSDGAPDISWIPPKIPRGLTPASELRSRVGEARSRSTRIRRTSVPTVPAADLREYTAIDSSMLGGIKDLPIFVLPGYELWSGAVKLPDDPSLGPLRIVVREFEHYRADPEVGRLDDDWRHDPHIVGPYLDRVVYADIVPLP